MITQNIDDTPSDLWEYRVLRGMKPERHDNLVLDRRGTIIEDILAQVNI